MTSVLAVVNSSGAYVDLPMPAWNAYKSIGNEIVIANRNVLGDLYKRRITVKRTISVEWHGVSPAEKTQIMSLTSANDFDLRYFDMETSEIRYGKFYRGSDADVIPMGRFNGTDFERYNVVMSLVEK